MAVPNIAVPVCHAPAERKGIEPSGVNPAPAFEAGWLPLAATLHIGVPPRTATINGDTIGPIGGPERMTGIEPASLVWKTMTLPLSYIRKECETSDFTRFPLRQGESALTCP